MHTNLHNLKITDMATTRKSKVKLKKLNVEGIVNDYFCQRKSYYYSCYFNYQHPSNHYCHSLLLLPILLAKTLQHYCHHH
jgi:hypothetical protein